MIRIIFALFRHPAFIIGLALFLTAIYFYNRLIKARIKVDEALSAIDVQLEKRQGLLQRLNGLLLASGLQESAFHDKLNALSQVDKPEPIDTDVPHVAKTEAHVRQEMRELLSDLSDEPVLSSQENFRTLNKSFEETDDELHLACRYYNAVVRDYNIQVESFPAGLLAAVLNLKKREFFVISGKEEST